MADAVGTDRRITIRHVAEAAGVSQSTVSRAFSGQGYVSNLARARIVASAESLGYVPNALARGLRARATRAIGVLISDLRNPFYSEVASGIERELRARGYQMILGDSDGAVDEERDAVRTFRTFRVDGVILTPTSETPDFVAGLAAAGVAVVEVDRVTGTADADGVLVENAAGAYQAVRHLLELGHTRIGILIGETAYTTGAERLAGSRRAFDDFGVEFDDELVVYTSFHPRDAKADAIALLRAHPEITALFATNNLLAQGAVRAIWELGLRIPRDVSLVAFDDLDWMTFTSPTITTVAQPTQEIGREAATLILDRLSGDLLGPGIVRRLPTRFVRRESTGTVRKAGARP